MKEQNKITIFLVLASVLLALGGRARCDDLRVISMGNTRIALDDEDNRLNPYDFGRNPAYLLLDYHGHWTRLDLGTTGETGDLRRPYDPDQIADYFGGASGIQRLGVRHVITGRIRYGWLNDNGVWRSLELDQYNDPFYMTDRTTGNFQHVGPSMMVDYSLQLKPQLYLGAGLDYDISTGLKDTYTRPEIVHNHFMANLGVIYRAKPDWVVGLIARPRRTQNRTEFEKTEEEFDNLIFRYYGDGIYDMRAVTAMTVREVLKGFEIGLQNFVTLDRLTVGAQLSYDYEDSEIKYGSSTQEMLGYWQDSKFEIGAIGRYVLKDLPLTVGLSGRYSTNEGWAKRPEYADVLLYDNTVDLWSGGVGAVYRVRSLKTLVSAEYVANAYDIKAADYGAGTSQDVGIVQNIGRLGLEYALFDVHSLWAGAEVTDYLVDRWLKLPANTDRYNFTAGMRYHFDYWDLEFGFNYGVDTKESTDADRQSYGGVVRFTHIMN
jgi:hypothetical protein